MASAARAQDYISLMRANAKKFAEAVNVFLAAQREWQALGYGSTLPEGAGANNGITRAEVDAVVNAMTDAVDAVLRANGRLHLASLKKLL